MSIIVMSDDDFEKNMDFLASQFNPVLADSFRHRDTAQREALEQLRTERRHDAQIQSAMAADQKAVAEALGIPPGEYSGGAGEQLLAIEKLREALARVEAERDTAIVQMQNIRKNRDRLNKEQCDTEFTLCIAQQQLAEAVGLLRYSQEIARLFDDEHTAEVGRFLDRHAQAEQQEECAHEFVPFQPACLKCGELYQAEQQEAQDAQLDKDARIALLERELDRERERADMAEVELQHARAALATRSEASQFAAAAAFVRNMATDYANEHGWDDMGGLSFGAGPQGTAKMEHFLFLEELAEKLRTMTTEGGAGHA